MEQKYMDLPGYFQGKRVIRPPYATMVRDFTTVKNEAIQYLNEHGYIKEFALYVVLLSGISPEDSSLARDAMSSKQAVNNLKRLGFIEEKNEFIILNDTVSEQGSD